MDSKYFVIIVLLFACTLFARVQLFNMQTERLIEQAKPDKDLSLLIVFNGNHDIEANNLLGSIKKNTPQFLPHILVCVSDDSSKNFALKHNLNYFVMPTINESGVYMSREMNTFTRRKFEAIVHLLEQKKDILYVDTDVVFLSNPLPWIKIDYDLNIQDDVCYLPAQNQELCTGFMYIKTNARTITFFKQAIAEMVARDYKSFADQNALNYLLEQQTLPISVNVLDLCKYPNGCRYFRKSYAFCRTSDALIVHNNYLVGVPEKMQRFKQYNLIFTDYN